MTDDTTDNRNIIQRIVAIKQAVGPVKKQERNSQQGWNFRGVDAVVNAVEDHMSENGVVIYPSKTVTQKTTMTTNKGSQVNVSLVTVDYTFTDGTSSIVAQVSAESFDSGDKATTKAMSVAYRIVLLQTLTLPTDDRDPDHDIYDAQPQQRPAPATQEQIASLAEWAQTDRDALNISMMRVIGRLASPNDISSKEATLLLLDLESEQPEG